MRNNFACQCLQYINISVTAKSIVEWYILIIFIFYFFSDRKEMMEFGAKYGVTCKQVRTRIVNTRRKRMMEKKHVKSLLAIDWLMYFHTIFWDNISRIKKNQCLFHAAKDLVQALVCYVRLIFMGEIKMSKLTLVWTMKINAPKYKKFSLRAEPRNFLAVNISCLNPSSVYLCSNIVCTRDVCTRP